jgi:uncharacterized damage-inducible protein DinB
MSKTHDESARKRLLVRLLDEAYTKTGFNDRSLRRSLRGVDPEEAAWRPGRGRHNIQEEVVHVAYWKHVIRRRVAGEETVPFAEKGRDWFPRNGGDERDWKRDRKLLADTHARLRELVVGKESFSDRDLYNVIGAAFHDVYHTAQIELIRRLTATRRTRKRGPRPGARRRATRR